jgi:hypothetical protein
MNWDGLVSDDLWNLAGHFSIDSLTLTLPGEITYVPVELKSAADVLYLRVSEEQVRCIDDWPFSKPVTGLWVQHPPIILEPDGCKA